MTTNALDLPRMLRLAGDVLGLALAAGFVVAALVCWGHYGRHLAIAGRPSTDVETLMLVVRDGTLPLRAAHWLAAWAWLVGAGGSAIMAVAGMRWAWTRFRDVLAERGR